MMGSSKKHKDKEHKHKRRKHRSRDRSRSGSKERRRAERDKSQHERKRHKGEAFSLEDEELSEQLMAAEYRRSATPEQQQSPVLPKQELSEEDVQSFSAAAASGGTVSLSIQQTNELRAKLGLKPLEVDENVDKGDESGDKKQDVHVPAVNLAAVRKAEVLREKMNVLRDKRRVADVLSKVKTLGESDDEGDSAAAWVMKSRKIEEERRQAELRAKMLEEMDSEFGIGNLMDEEFGTKRKQEYGAKDLKGLRVEHDQNLLKEGRTVILTLKDKGILDEEFEDTLINVNLLDDEKAAKNVENKKKKPMYQAYDDSEFDECGSLKVKEVLDKYDEVIHGDKKESFELGDAGRYNPVYERQMREMKATLRLQAESLTLPTPNIASEFFTAAEMDAAAQFKKVTKKKKVPTATLR